MIGGVGERDAELEEAVQLALQDYLASEGFSDPVRARTGGLVFRRGDVLLRFLRSDRAPAHPFEVQVSLGQQRTNDIVDWVRVSRLSQEGSIAHACWTWEVPELPSLTDALGLLLADVLVPHVAEFWRDPGRLEAVLEALEREAELRRGAEQQSLRVARAERYFERLESERADPDPDG
jgi:hypothetical protein